MRILFSSTSYLPAIGGAQLHTHCTAKQLSNDHAVSVLTLWDTNRNDWLLGTTLKANSTVREYTVEGIPVHRMGFSAREKALLVPSVLSYYVIQSAAIKAIATLLAGKMESHIQGSDIIHNGRIGREPLSFASYSLARKHNVPFFLTPFHHPRWRGWLYRNYASLYRKADGLITITHAEKRMLVHLGVPEHRIFVTGMGPIVSPDANGSRFRGIYGIEGPIVLFIGQHFEHKGYRELLEATALVWRKHTDTHFVFIGPSVGNSERYFKRAEGSRIHRLGTVDLQTKTDALAACDTLCLPSTQESFGGVFAEAWTQGKPVIGCPIPAVREVVDDGVNGLLVKQDPAEIADAICVLLNDGSVRNRLGAAGKIKVEENYTWDQIGKQTEAAYIAVTRGELG